MNIRPAESSDAFAISEVQRRSWAHVYSPAMVKNMLASLSSTKHQLLWRQRLGDASKQTWVLAQREVKGFLMLDWAEQPVELSAFYLCPSIIGQGQGRRLFEHAHQLVKRRGCQQMQLWVMDDNQHALGFYRHLGAEFTGASRQGQVWQQDYQQLQAQFLLKQRVSAAAL